MALSKPRNEMKGNINSIETRSPILPKLLTSINSGRSRRVDLFSPLAKASTNPYENIFFINLNF